MQYLSEPLNHQKQGAAGLEQAVVQGQTVLPYSAYPSRPRIGRPNAGQTVAGVRSARTLAFTRVREESRKRGVTPSSLLRSALHQAAMAGSERVKAAVVQVESRDVTPPHSSQAASLEGAAVPTTAAPTSKPVDVPRFPQEMWSLVQQMRGFGPSSWGERRRRLLQAIALSQVCVEASQEARDVELLADLLRLASKYGLLTV